ncbi:Cortactin-binding protein [Wickerhamomyces ciferrii]|uniref:Cortactin-binding protein n=1 Tax=Wickerhamomyces ciferrii (strain ATCC 14091 / BCRC 22168 / CBS 111 / JCM 3599 / NBRC 0793 / NRRL Y-1031 F-60-10) TaxID=1206466 RepID=K0KM15_WICCF|nr:Cortactin-binding protein [Wickerhamomyces ciferrii]CCH43247.1 Cortactin-binding protein [Wickerhamomyces ciferrii]
MNTAQIDLENLFSDPKNMPEFIPDYSIDEIDQALNDALAEINQNQEEILGVKDEPNKKRINDEELINENFKFQKHNEFNELELNIKPLSPESLHSDTSLVNSPRHDETKPSNLHTHQSQSQSQQPPQLALPKIHKQSQSQQHLQLQQQQSQIEKISNNFQKQQEQFHLEKNQLIEKSNKDQATIKNLQSLLIESEKNYKNLSCKFQDKSKDYEYLIKELHNSEMKRIELMDENNHLKKCVSSLTFK